MSFGISCQLEALSVYRLALLDLQLDRDADVQDAREWADASSVLGFFRAIGSPPVISAYSFSLLFLLR